MASCDTSYEKAVDPKRHGEFDLAFSFGIRSCFLSSHRLLCAVAVLKVHATGDAIVPYRWEPVLCRQSAHLRLLVLGCLASSLNSCLTMRNQYSGTSGWPSVEVDSRRWANRTKCTVSCSLLRVYFCTHSFESAGRSSADLEAEGLSQ